MANPDPSRDTRFGAENGNQPNGGKTSAQRLAEYEAAEKSAILRNMALSCIMEKIGRGKMSDADLELVLNPSALKLFKDSEDRAHGTPKATQEMSGPNGGAIPVSEVRYTVFDPVKDAD